MYNNGDYFYFQNNFLCFCIYVTNVCSAFMLSPIIKIQGFWYLVGLWSCEIHKNTLNTAKLARNLITYMSIQHIWNLSCQLGLCSCCKLANLSWNFITTMSNIKHLSNQCKIYQFLVKFAQKIVTKSAVFYWLVSVTFKLWKFRWSQPIFPWICLWKSCEIWLFFPRPIRSPKIPNSGKWLESKAFCICRLRKPTSWIFNNLE